MRKILTTFAAAGLVMFLAACTLLQGALGTNTADGARKAAGAALTVYAQSWQPMLKVYSQLPVCGSPARAPCQDPKLYRKLYDLDGAASSCIVAATIALNAASPDFSKVTGCVDSINQAELSFAQAGIVVKVGP